MSLCISDGFAVGFDEQILSYNTNMTLSNISTESMIQKYYKMNLYRKPRIFRVFFSSNYTLIYNQ